MLNKKEILIIAAISLILAVSISLTNILEDFLSALLIVFIVLILNISAKKIVGLYLESEIEIKLWEFRMHQSKRVGFKSSKGSFPIGALLPLVSKILFFSLKNFVWMASLIFDVKPKSYRAAKRHGLYSFSEMTESHIGLIATSGILINLISAILGYILGFPNFAQISIYFAFFNMLPISDLDGNKIFFGNLVLWSFLAAITVIGIFFAIFVI